MFDKGDRNQDGMITKEELAGMQRNPGQQPPRRNPRQ
jgi:Ca2+-binding EF-hand superfamily protein